MVSAMQESLGRQESPRRQESPWRRESFRRQDSPRSKESNSSLAAPDPTQCKWIEEARILSMLDEYRINLLEHVERHHERLLINIACNAEPLPGVQEKDRNIASLPADVNLRGSVFTEYTIGDAGEDAGEDNRPSVTASLSGLALPIPEEAASTDNDYCISPTHRRMTQQYSQKAYKDEPSNGAEYQWHAEKKRNSEQNPDNGTKPGRLSPMPHIIPSSSTRGSALSNMVGGLIMLSKSESAFQFSCCPWRKRRKQRMLQRSGSVRLKEVMNNKSQKETPWFDCAVGMVIMLNALVMVVQFQWAGYVTSLLLGHGSGGFDWPHAELVFDILEYSFAAFFLLELITRLCLNGIQYFRDVGNFFDLGLVVTSIIDLCLLKAMGKGGNGNLTFIRFARLMKFVRVLRIVRVMKMFSSLRVLVKTIHSSTRALIWSMVLLGIVMGIGGLVLCQMLTDWIRNEENDALSRDWVYQHYGSSSRAMYTMFEATLSGCWPQYVRPLIDISDWYALFWIMYVTVVMFAVIRVITALFLKETLQNANEDADMMINEQLKKKSAYIEKLAQAFEAMDETGDGTISLDEFSKMLSNQKFMAYLSVLDLEVADTWTLFHLLDNGEGCITYAEFLEGVLRLKGQARSVDLICLQRDTREIHNAIAQLSKQVSLVGGQKSHTPQVVERNATIARKRALHLTKVQHVTSGTGL